ncbi:MAG: hypothetical protein AB7N91_26865 [Candidatus Tectimicrobiota bacterium]
MSGMTMDIGLGLWHRGRPEVATLFAYIDLAEASGIDSVWLSAPLLGEGAEVAVLPMMAARPLRRVRAVSNPDRVS